jgi:hypothetical protein
MRFCSAWLVLVLGPTASAAEATPFTFGFVLSYTSTVRPNATLGTVMTLDVIVENHPSMDTQSFLFNDVVSLLVGTNGGYRHAYLGGPTVLLVKFQPARSSRPMLRARQ